MPDAVRQPAAELDSGTVSKSTSRSARRIPHAEREEHLGSLRRGVRATLLAPITVARFPFPCVRHGSLDAICARRITLRPTPYALRPLPSAPRHPTPDTSTAPRHSPLIRPLPPPQRAHRPDCPPVCRQNHSHANTTCRSSQEQKHVAAQLP